MTANRHSTSENPPLKLNNLTEKMREKIIKRAEMREIAQSVRVLREMRETWHARNQFVRFFSYNLAHPWNSA